MTGAAEIAAPRKATLSQLVFMTYAVICSGAYGLEEMISATGPGLALVILIVLPLAYAAPMALTCSELSSRFPVEGGYYRWVRIAFGDFAGYTAAWLVWLTMFATNASFAVLFGNYLRYFVPQLSPLAHFLCAAGLVWLAVLLNYRGISLVGKASMIFTALIFVPFAVLTVLGFLQWRYSPLTPFAHPEQPVGMSLVNGVLIAMWLYGGFEKLTVNAEEIENPVRAFPIALGIGVPLCALSYILPTAAALAAGGDWRDWGEAYYVTAAAKVGGPWLGAAMAAGGLISNAGIVMVTMLAQSRLPMVLAEDGFFPKVFQSRHARFGTPVVSLVVTGLALTVLCGFRFTQLVSAYSVVQALAYLLIYAALFKLRRQPDTAESAFRIPLGSLGLGLMVAPTLVIGALMLRQGLMHEGQLDVAQALFTLMLLASGPATYALTRRRARRASGLAPRAEATP